MSSGYSGRYQSKLFNFVHQQSRRLTEQWENTFRQLQVATKLGVDALLYQVYQMFQSDELAGKRLHTKEPQPRRQLQPETPPPADTPIQHILEVVQNLSTEEPTTTPAKTSQTFNLLAVLGSFWEKFVPNHQPKSLRIPDKLAVETENTLKGHLPVIRGIATHLGNRNLVLVTAENQILDILTPQQQAKLADRIIGEVADYWHSWQLAEAKKEAALLPEIDRILAKLTGTNRENTPLLAAGKIAADGRENKYLLNPGKVLALLDTALAQVESNALVTVQQHSREIMQTAQTQLNIFLYGKEQLEARGQIAVSADGLETQTLKIQALIEAAVKYFFGDRTGKKLEPTETKVKLQGKVLNQSSRKALPKNEQVQQGYVIVDPWLTLNDLFGDAEASPDEVIIPFSSINQAIASSPSAENSPPDDLNHSAQDLLQNLKSGLGFFEGKKLTQNRGSNPKKSAKVPANKKTTSRISQGGSEKNKRELYQMQVRQNTQVEAQPDWIETTATLLGYEKHPLEVLLAWLDRAMLWLEQIFVNIFQFFQGLLRGK
ncbi:hypothetical protein [Cylindrospermum sp. FACHB-282]|uniref:hypothetical protein n=1 Tax=Cylindrospermum sp. FACHB-282 TaxID=2692794 RepID=UPI0016832D77|nr:hypothetical protein [Cylindrospermum sp. FACHB-282]MBD2385567.1 hypothetical protein [Cylindrospermum sp. FACHB-282]